MEEQQTVSVIRIMAGPRAHGCGDRNLGMGQYGDIQWLGSCCSPMGLVLSISLRFNNNNNNNTHQASASIGQELRLLVTPCVIQPEEGPWTSDHGWKTKVKA